MSSFWWIYFVLNHSVKLFRLIIWICLFILTNITSHKSVSSEHFSEIVFIQKVVDIIHCLLISTIILILIKAILVVLIVIVLIVIVLIVGIKSRCLWLVWVLVVVILLSKLIVISEWVVIGSIFLLRRHCWRSIQFVSG